MARQRGRFQCFSISSKHFRMAVSMPASRSTFTNPTVSMSFLSHWMTVRSFMVAGSMGHKSMRSPSEIVKPPLWMPTWRGMPRMSSAI